MSISSDPDTSGNRQSLIWLAVGVVLLFVLLAFGFGSRLMMPFGPNKAVLNQPGGPANEVLQKTDNDGPPVLMKTDQNTPILPIDAKKMPQDILDWLKHLEETEKRRNSLSHDQMSSVLVSMTKLSLGGTEDVIKGLLGGDADVLDGKGPAEDVKMDIGKKREEWHKLNEFFRSKSPPPSCVPIFNAYEEALVETSSAILEVMTAMDKGAEDPDGAVAGLSKMKGQSDRIDKAGGETDRLVQRICDEYETRKWFSISGDFGGGTMDKISGFVPKL